MKTASKGLESTFRSDPEGLEWLRNPHAAEDVTAGAFRFRSGIVGTGIWNFNAERSTDEIRILGSRGELVTPILADADVTVTKDGATEVHPFRNPPHVHQPLIQTIVDELLGRGRCESTGESGARASWVLDQCLGDFYTAPKA